MPSSYNVLTRSQLFSALRTWPLHLGNGGLGFLEGRLGFGQLVLHLFGFDLQRRSLLGQGALLGGVLGLGVSDLVARTFAVELNILAQFLELEVDHVDSRLRLVEAQLVIGAVQLQQHVAFLHHAALVDVQGLHRAAHLRRHRHHQALDTRVVGHHVLGRVNPVINSVIQTDDHPEAQDDGG